MSTETKLWKECDTKDQVRKFVKSLDAATCISVVESRGKFYVEDEAVFVRTYETLHYQGNAGKLKF